MSKKQSAPEPGKTPEDEFEQEPMGGGVPDKRAKYIDENKYEGMLATYRTYAQQNGVKGPMRHSPFFDGILKDSVTGRQRYIHECFSAAPDIFVKIEGLVKDGAGAGKYRFPLKREEVNAYAITFGIKQKPNDDNPFTIVVNEDDIKYAKFCRKDIIEYIGTGDSYTRAMRTILKDLERIKSKTIPGALFVEQYILDTMHPSDR